MINRKSFYYILFLIPLMCSLVTAGHAQKNNIESAFRHEFFAEDIEDRSYSYLQYGRKFNDHELLLRINNLTRSGESGFLYEVDFYPKFTDKSYGYFNISASDFKLFPKFRTAAEYFQVFAEKWEFSVGLRTVHVDNYNIIAPTGTLGLYYGNWYSYLRPTFNILEDGISGSLMFVTRRYFGDGEDYLELLLLNGEDRGAQRQFNAIENTFGLDTYVIRLRGVRKFNEKYAASAGVDYSGLLIVERDKYIKITSFDLTLKRFF